MGNKQNVPPPPPSRAYSTVTHPSSSSSSNHLLRTNSQQHHRINRRRSDFQQNCGKRQNSNQISGNGTNNIIGNNFPVTTIPNNNAAIINTNDGPNSNETAVLERMRPIKGRRYSIANATSRGANSQHVIKPKRITPRQCHLCIKSWNKRAPKNRIVKDIFAAIFTEAEELKTTFGIEIGVVGKKLRADSNFISHTNMFTDTLDFVIRNLDDLSLVIENTEQLGRRHASFPLENGFRPEYWNLFSECIIEGISAGEEDKETQIAWRQLVQTIVYYMKLGYDREKIRLTRHSSFRRSPSPMPASRMQQMQQGQKISVNSCQLQSANSSSQFSTSENRHTKE